MTRVMVVPTALSALAASLLVVAVAAPASAGGPHYAGAAPGEVSCSLSATLRFSPVLTDGGGGSGPSTLSGKLSHCTAGYAGARISGARLTGSFADTPITCPGLSSNHASATLTIAWRGSLRGDVDGQYYSGPAHLSDSDVTTSDEEAATGSGGDLDIVVPGASGLSTGTGSFPDPTLVLVTRDPASKLGAMCDTAATGGRGKGISKLSVTGTLDAGLTSYSAPACDFAQSITSGPDGALWFSCGSDTDNSSIGRITTAGAVTAYTAPTIDDPQDITAGSDGALWFTNEMNNSIGRITTGGVVSNFTDPTIDEPQDITAGPDGALWFTNFGNNSIGRITTGGAVSNYTAPTIDEPMGITAGPDGALWFVNYGNNSIGRISTGGAVSNYTAPTIDGPEAITAGPDGALWFTNIVGSSGSIGRITTGGVVSNYPDAFSESSSAQIFTSITSGPDDTLWFGVNQVFGLTGALLAGLGSITTTGQVTDYAVPGVDGITSVALGPDGNVWVTPLLGQQVDTLAP